METQGKNLSLRFLRESDRINDEMLPGWREALEANPGLKSEISQLAARIENAIRDEDEIRYEEVAIPFARLHDQLNVIVAEEYRAKNTDPELWELRYIKWMKISFIKFDSPMGEFFLTPRTPKKTPKARHWYTVDEMMSLVRGPVAELIKMGGVLPDRADVLQPPGPGERVIHIDATSQPVRTYYETKKRSRYG